MSDDHLKVIRASDIPPPERMGDRGLPFVCFECGGKPSHLAHSRKHHWVWACSNDGCVPSGYNVELTRMKNEADGLDWTLHLMEKVWFPETNFAWSRRLRERFGYRNA